MDILSALSFITNLVGLSAILAASLVKGQRMRLILILVTTANVLVATSYLLAGSGFNCAASCLVAGVQGVINYFFDAKNKPIPKWLIGVYALSLIAVNLWVSGLHLLTLLAIAACMAFILSIFQSGGSGYRICTLVNTALWSTYDVLTHSWNGLLTHVTIFVFTVASILYWGYKKRKAA